MKAILCSIFILCVGLPINLFADNGLEEIIFVPAPVSEVIVFPEYKIGNVKVWINGVFKNGCYSWSHAEVVESQREDFIITLYPIAQFYTGICTMALSHYNKVIHLKIIDPGNYRILVQTSGGRVMERNTSVE